MLMAADLPENVPIPESRPEIGPGVKQDNKAAKPQDDDKKGDDSPISKPDQTKPADTVEEYVPPPIETEDPALLKACLAQIQTLGVTYKDVPRIDDGNGCGIDHPILVTAVGGQISLKPGGTMRCETALALAHWTKEIVVPMLKTARPDDTLVALDQASTYVCRKRNSAATGKISEHAHGNAVDVAGLRFRNGDAFSIKPRMKDSTMDGALQRAITTAACLYFTTVLDPGSDKAHETHLHLDIIKRKSGYRLCW
jgi:hypothetical protein